MWKTKSSILSYFGKFMIVFKKMFIAFFRDHPLMMSPPVGDLLCKKKTYQTVNPIEIFKGKCVSASMFERLVNQATVQRFPLVDPSSLYNLEAGDTPEPSGLASSVPPLRLKIPRPSGA